MIYWSYVKIPQEPETVIETVPDNSFDERDVADAVITVGADRLKT